MKHILVFANDQVGFDKANGCMAEGWELDPRFDGKPLRMDAAVVFPLVLYESEEERPKPFEEVRKGEFDDVVSMRDVANGDVDGLLKEGYVIHSIYAKNTILLKRGVLEPVSEVVSRLFGERAPNVSKLAEEY